MSKRVYKFTEHLVAGLVGFTTESDKEFPNTVTNPSDTDFSETSSWLISPGLRYQKGDWVGHVFYSRSEQILCRAANFGGSLFEAESTVESDEIYS